MKEITPICFVSTETLQVLFKTNFPTVLPFYPLEILLFAFLGRLSVWKQAAVRSRELLLPLLPSVDPAIYQNKSSHHEDADDRVRAQSLQCESSDESPVVKGLYSGMVAFLLATVTFPHFTGQYMASKYTMKQLLTSLLDSRQWTSQSHNASVQLEPETLLEWSSSGSPVCLSLAFFLLMKSCCGCSDVQRFVCVSVVGSETWMLVLACTLPVPSGYFMPVFVYGAALGRLLGEGVAYAFSTGVTSDQQRAAVNPGGYALAGAAALSGAVTHTLSPALLAIELTGQFSHSVPVLLATLLANALARSGHRPSFYDALSISKRLPHLPSLKKACPRLPSTPVGQVLGVKSVQLQKAAAPAEVQHAVNTSSETQIPVVDSHGVQTEISDSIVPQCYR
ncbi:chloride channel protein ClC-Ka [Lates japonicus]|uniref:Chloride channel protein ClC-Ka n=1 Tax=Lates japonicus TaxID=270547 RepID=A0AAD3QW77_LATJO|nr:chloride channel protein ClC-Ka [Lates japonicus]